MKHNVEPLEYSREILNQLPKGILMTTKVNDKVNTMTIGWGQIGIEWRKPVFIAFVRESRYTKEMLDQNPEFTINVPLGDLDRKILGVCGSKSGRNMDKVEELNLHLEQPEKISVPGIKELPLTLECKVIYTQVQDIKNIPQSVQDQFYPIIVQNNSSSNQDVHIAYYGEIVNAYICV